MLISILYHDRLNHPANAGPKTGADLAYRPVGIEVVLLGSRGREIEFVVVFSSLHAQLGCIPRMDELAAAATFCERSVDPLSILFLARVW